MEIRTEVLQLQPLPSRAFFPYLNGVLVPTLWPCVYVCVSYTPAPGSERDPPIPLPPQHTHPGGEGSTLSPKH